MAGAGAENLAKIDPGFAELIKSFPNTDWADIDFVTFRETLAASQEQLKASLPPAEGITIASSSIKARDGHEVEIWTYKPNTTKAGGAPLVVLFHGGGFCVGSPAMEEVNARRCCKELGCVVINAAYRLAPEHPFPCGITDAWETLKWAAANAKELGADPKAGFIVGGTSAGGNIAAVLSFQAKEENLSPPLTGTLLLIPGVTDHFNPPAKYASEIISMEQNKDAPFLTKSIMEKFIEALKPDTSSTWYNLLQVDPTGLKGLPPTVFQICGLDPLRDEALVYERVLKEEASVKTQLKIYPGLPHGFWAPFPEWEKSIKFRQDTIDGVAWLLEIGKN